jgi:hypothetical protein
MSLSSDEYWHCGIVEDYLVHLQNKKYIMERDGSSEVRVDVS